MRRGARWPRLMRWTKNCKTVSHGKERSGSARSPLGERLVRTQQLRARAGGTGTALSPTFQAGRRQRLRRHSARLRPTAGGVGTRRVGWGVGVLGPIAPAPDQGARRLTSAPDALAVCRQLRTRRNGSDRWGALGCCAARRRALRQRSYRSLCRCEGCTDLMVFIPRHPSCARCRMACRMRRSSMC